jgi:hypothetical protein
VFPGKRALYKHVTATHTRGDRFACTVEGCTNAYQFDYELKDHMHSHEVCVCVCVCAFVFLMERRRAGRLGAERRGERWEMRKAEKGGEERRSREKKYQL